MKPPPVEAPCCAKLCQPIFSAGALLHEATAGRSALLRETLPARLLSRRRRSLGRRRRRRRLLLLRQHALRQAAERVARGRARRLVRLALLLEVKVRVREEAEGRVHALRAEAGAGRGALLRKRHPAAARLGALRRRRL